MPVICDSITRMYFICTQLHFHASSLESLHEHFDIEVLPEELGGKLPPGDELAKVIAFFLFWCSHVLFDVCTKIISRSFVVRSQSSVIRQ